MRDLYERVLEQRASRGMRSDVDVDDIVAVVERRGSEEHRLAILNRLLATAEGRRELDLVRASLASSPSSQSSDHAPRFRLPLAIAATIIIAAVSRTMLVDLPNDGTRDGGTSSAITLVSPTEALVQSETLRFVWTRVPAATAYAPELIDDSGLVVWTGITTDTSIVLSPGVSMNPDRTYRWRVVARTEAGNISSAARPVRVLPR